MDTSRDTAARRTPGRTLLVGYGRLAARLAEALVVDGDEVFAVRRSDGELAGSVQGVVADVSSPLVAPLPDADALVITLPPSGAVGGYRRGLENLVDALPSLPTRTVFVSSTGVFEGAGPERVLTEHDEPTSQTERVQALLDGERAARELFSAVVVRPAGIYGPGRDFLLRRVREQAAVDHRRWTNRIHEVDLARVLHELVRMPSPPALVHAVDEKPVQLGEVVEYIARRLSIAIPPDTGAEASGHVLDGARMREVLGDLAFPTYVEVYDGMLE